MEPHLYGIDDRWCNRSHLLKLDASDELGEDDEIQDDGRRQQGVFARVVHDDGVAAAHEDLAGVLIHGTLAICHVGYILDHHHVVGVLARPVQDGVRVHLGQTVVEVNLPP